MIQLLSTFLIRNTKIIQVVEYSLVRRKSTDLISVCLMRKELLDTKTKIWSKRGKIRVRSKSETNVRQVSAKCPPYVHQMSVNLERHPGTRVFRTCPHLSKKCPPTDISRTTGGHLADMSRTLGGQMLRFWTSMKNPRRKTLGFPHNRGRTLVRE